LVIDAGGSVVANSVFQGTVELNGSTVNPPLPAPVLSIRPKAEGGVTSVVRTVAIGSDETGKLAGRIDLADTAMVFDYYFAGQSPIATVRSLLAAGRDGGTWAGNGISSSVAAGQASTRGLGYAEASAVLGARGGAFEGQAVDGTAVLVRYTVLGDATLDGRVNFGDLLRLAKNYNSTGADWFGGDFDYDGRVNFADLLALAKNYNQALPADVPGAPAGFGADLAAAFAAVPEPGGVGVIAVVGVGLAMRRRTRFGGRGR
jgi:hypothetical protein